MSLVHVLHDARLGFQKAFGAIKRQEKLARLKIEDATEAANIVGAFDLEAPEAEIGEVNVERRLWETGEEAPPDRILGAWLGTAVECHARALQGIGERPCLVHQDRGAGILNEIGGVAGELRDQEDRRAGRSVASVTREA